MPLQAVGDLEDAALALDLGEARFARAVGHVLAEDHDARVARHLVVQARVEQVDHGLRARPAAAARCAKAAERRVDVGRVDVAQRALAGSGSGAASAASRGRVHLAVDLLAEPRELGRRWRRPPRAGGAGRQRAGRARRPLRAPRASGRALVVGERVGVGPDHLGVHQRGARARAAPGRRLAAARPGSPAGRSRRPRAPAGSGNVRTSLEMLPPAVCTSTGTEIA